MMKYCKCGHQKRYHSYLGSNICLYPIDAGQRCLCTGYAESTHLDVAEPRLPEPEEPEFVYNPFASPFMELRSKRMWFVATFLCIIAGAFAGFLVFIPYPAPASFYFAAWIMSSSTFLFLWYLIVARSSRCPSCKRLGGGKLIERQFGQYEVDTKDKLLMCDKYECRHCQHKWKRNWVMMTEWRE